MDFKFKKSWGQNFLVDKNIIDKIVRSSCIDKDTLVIEIGPGKGAISKFIVPKSKRTILYEIDERLEEYLNDLLKGNDNYSVIIGDFLKEDVKREISKYNYDKLYVIANLPYYITTPIITKFIDDEIFPDRMVFMMQKEVADRLSASVGTKDYGALTVFLNYYYNIVKIFDVNRNCFVPKPNVDSAVVCFDKKNVRLDVKDINLFKKIVKASFKYKRKNLRNNLKEYDLDKVSEVLKKYDMDLSVRAESLSLEIFVDISNNL